MMRTRVLIPLLLAPALACGGTPNTIRNDTMTSEDSRNLESNPKTYVVNSVLGSIQCDGKPVANATIKIVQTGEVHPAGDAGSFVLELDPGKLGTNVHQLVFSAPGFRDQEHSVVIADNDQTHLTVVLERE